MVDAERLTHLPLYPAVEDGRYCTRCGVKTFHLDPPHLCTDVANRLARRERQIEGVIQLLLAHRKANYRHIAELIVAKLANMGVQDD